MAKAAGFFIFIMILAFIINLYSGSEYVMKRYEINKINYLTQNEYTVGKVKDFCGISKIDHYYKNRDSCCEAKLSCDNRIAKWDSNIQTCSCS